jgi:hypothetical protein
MTARLSELVCVESVPAGAGVGAGAGGMVALLAEREIEGLSGKPVPQPTSGKTANKKSENFMFPPLMSSETLKFTLTETGMSQ